MLNKFNTLYTPFPKIKTMKYFAMSFSKIYQLIILTNIVIFSACSNYNAQIVNETNSTQTTKTPLDIQTIETPLGRFDVSINKTYNTWRRSREKQIAIELKIEGKNAKYIKGYKFTKGAILSDGQKFKIVSRGGTSHPIFTSSFRGEEYKHWFKPVKHTTLYSLEDRTYYIENDIFYVPRIYANIDTSVYTIDIKGELKLLVASEENMCACKVENFMEQPQLANRVFEFNGGSIKFVEEPTYELYDREYDKLHTFNFLLEDAPELLFDMYIEGADGKELKMNGVGHGPVQKDKVKVNLTLIDKPEKDYKLVVVYGQESCRVTIPFELKNIILSK